MSNTPTSEELHEALEWIKEHKKRSIAHILVLLAIAGPVAFVVSAHTCVYAGMAYFLAISASLFVF